MDKVSAIFRCHNPIMTLKNIKRRTAPLNLQLTRAESVPRAVASMASEVGYWRKPRSLPLAVLISIVICAYSGAIFYHLGNAETVEEYPRRQTEVIRT
jgi:hypothetical protein